MPSIKMWKVVRALCSDRGSSRPFEYIGLALRKTLHETTNIFFDVYVPSLPSSSLSLSSSSACVLDDSFTLLELRPAVCLMRRCSDSGPYRIPSQALLNLPEVALLKLLQWYNKIWETRRVPPECKEA